MNVVARIPALAALAATALAVAAADVEGAVWPVGFLSPDVRAGRELRE